MRVRNRRRTKRGGILRLIQIRFDDARSRLAGLLDLSRTGVSNFGTPTQALSHKSLRARARAAGRNGIRLSTFPNNLKRQPKDKGASVRFRRSKSRPNPKSPVPVSVGTWPLLNRASWVQPPYDGGRVHAAAINLPVFVCES